MGLSDEQFYNTDMLFDVKCMICLMVIETPRKMSNCRHHYCEDCIDEWLTDADTCPQCMVTGESHPPALEMIYKIRSLPAKCAYYALGCELQIPFEQLDNHQRCCEYRIVSCPQRCGCSMPERDVATHLLTCALSGDPLVASLMCFECRYKYVNGGTPTHCDYYMQARYVWYNRRARWGNGNPNTQHNEAGSSSQ